MSTFSLNDKVGFSWFEEKKFGKENSSADMDRNKFVGDMDFLMYNMRLIWVKLSWLDF